MSTRQQFPHRADSIQLGSSPDSGNPFAGPPVLPYHGYEDSEGDGYNQRDTYVSESSGDLGGEGIYGERSIPDFSACTQSPSGTGRKGRSNEDADSEAESTFYRGGAFAAPSSESLMNPSQPPPGFRAHSGTSTPSFVDFTSLPYSRLREPYPAWSADAQIPLSKEEIEDVFIDLANKFGFQRDSMRNMYDHFMVQLDSRASRMSPNQALLTLHADYIGGEHANYRKWYFAAQLDLDDLIGQSRSNALTRKVSKVTKRNPAGQKSLDSAAARWRQAMASMSQYDRVRQIALYLLCWGEAAQVRFTPECLCFIFKCADDYYRSPECQNRTETVPEGLYLRAVVRPLYRFLRDQGYEVSDGVFVRRERDHDKIIGYDDVNQLFWYPEGINRIVLNDKVCISCSRRVLFGMLTLLADSFGRRSTVAAVYEV